MRTAFYMRMSTEKQEHSIDSQNEVLENFAQSNHLLVICKYVDEGISGRTAQKRPAFLRMIDDSAKNLFDSVLVYDSSRFARNLEESIVYKSYLRKNNVTLLSATEPLIDGESALITDAMLGALNEMYSHKLSKSVKRGMVYMAKQGYYPTTPPYGYKKQKAQIVIVKSEAAVVKKCFDWFLLSPSAHMVATQLNALNIPKRKSATWLSRDIRRMLSNPCYIGIVPYDGCQYPGKHEPIIDPLIWEAVQKLIMSKPLKKTRKRPPTSYKHWLSGIVRCGNCGGRMSHVTDAKGHRAYRCSRHANGQCSQSNYISLPVLEQHALTALNTVLKGDTQLFHCQVQDDTDFAAAQKRVLAKAKRFQSAYAAGIDTLAEYQINKAACQQELESLTQRQEVNAQSTSIQTKKTAAELLELLSDDTYTITQKSMAVQNVIDHILVDKSKGTITVHYFAG